MDNIKLLDTGLLKHKASLREAMYWKHLFRSQLGWHYILDLIWQIEQIDKLRLPAGAKILDAGAGYGMMQYILAGRGYDVYSVDFAPRMISWPKSWIFRMKYLKNEKYDDAYLDHLFAERRKHLAKVVLYEMKKTVLNYHVKLILETARRNRHGKIFYYQENFRDMNLIDNDFFDAIVSTSAIEHNKDLEDLSAAIREFFRVLKPGAPMFITTSVSKDKTWFHEPSHGWCFDESTLASLFDMDHFDSNLDKYEKVYQDIVSNDYLKKILSKHYYTSPKGGLPHGIWEPAYLPVGVSKWKRDRSV